SGQRALLTGDNSALPVLDFIEAPEEVRPGDRVVSSGDGGVFPAGLLVGNVVLARDGRLRLRLTADYERLEFLRVLRNQPGETISPPDGLVGPLLPAPSIALSEETGEAGDG
ncbi:MAG: rod shape-determining protein MreC, partial [Silicimonas sp.]|nr:rod shape-determining protein MreC [Silicimonas sp.]